MYWNVHHVILSVYSSPKRVTLGNSSYLTEVIVTSTVLPESITLSCLLAYFEMYGNYHIIYSVRERVPPPVGDWMAKRDLKDAYLQVPIHPNHQKYLVFQWDRKFYQFNCIYLVCQQPQEHLPNSSNPW